MDKAAVLTILAQFRQALERQGVHKARVVLFGSYHHGTAREGSDIDVVVVSEDFAGKSFWERVETLSAAIGEVFKPIQATALTPEEWTSGRYMICEYARDGEIVGV